MKIGVIYKGDQISGECAEHIKELLERDVAKASLNIEFVDVENSSSKVDLIIAVGGDGTTLKCVPHALQFDVPIVSINTGNVGFLSAYSKNQIASLVTDICRNDFLIQERAVLEVLVNGSKYYALNEILVERSHCECQIASFDFTIEGEDAINYCADGCLIATPTGSTAYSHSAGGSIIHPDSMVLIASAICPRNSKFNSIVFPMNKEAKITVCESKNPCRVFIDGVKCDELTKNGSVTVNSSLKKIKIIKTQSFFSLLNQKLN